MPVILNLKRCDNVKECGAPSACPTGAFFWDEQKKTLAVDISKCIDCFACAKCCSTGAILVVPDKDEYAETINLIENDPATIEDLFVDRYGAMTVKGTNELAVEDISEVINRSETLAAIEVLDADNPSCLISAIPYAVLFNGKNVALYKTMVSGENLDIAKDKLGVKHTPALVFIKNGKIVDTYQGSVNPGSVESVEFQKFVDNIFLKV